MKNSDGFPSDALATAQDHALSAPPLRERPFNLLRWFSILSFVAIVVVVGGGAMLLTKYLVRNNLLREAIVSRDFLEGVLAVDVGADFFSLPPNERDPSAFNPFVEHLKGLNGLVAAEIHRPDSVVIWSSDSQLLGGIENMDQLRKALRGYVSVQWGSDVAAQELRLRDRLRDRAARDRLVQFYLPIRGKTADDIIAVLELLVVPHALFDAINEDVRLTAIGAVGSGLLLYLAFFWIIHRADRIIRLQRERLIETETLATVGEMAGAVAHSIRNPLASIRSAAELARDEDARGLRECLDDIIAQADRLSGWVQELLLAARGAVDFSEAVDINDVVHESLNGKMVEVGQRNIDVTFDETPLPLVSGSRAMLSHAILNVISNATEAMTTGGNLRIESRPRGPDHVTISIEDTGGGIPGHIEGKIFRPLFTTKPNGLGLGLALTKRIIERHSGKITVESRSGHGTRVELTLPVRG